MSYSRPMTHQEYIQMKYLSNGDGGDSGKSGKVNKKRKLKHSIKAPTVKIVDDDIDIRQLAKRDSDEEELYFGTKEEKPIIAAVIDERPLAVQAGDVDRTKWKRVGDEDDNDNVMEKKQTKLSGTSARHHEDVDDDDETKRTHKDKPKTLSGKKAGLQNAKDIKKELDELKKKQAEMFKNMSDDVTGKNTQTVFRDRKTGKIRNMEKELAEKQEEMRIKALRDAEKKETYDRWSKGLVQREERFKQLESDLHEMSKPLARYGDDSDLDKLLREQDRDGDTMLSEIRQKREQEKARDPNYKVYPKYTGPPAPPNRFNIAPGYRWDGVDRSNGYENKYLSRINSAEASQEEIYRWSTQDM